MSMFLRRLSVLAVVVIGTGAGLAQAQAPSPYAPQSTATPPTTTVLPTTVVKELPTPQSRADKFAKTVGKAFNGISRKNLLHGTKITLAVNGGGTSIVQLKVAKKGSKTYRAIGNLHLTANGKSKTTTLKLTKVGKTRLAAAASKGKTFKAQIVVAIYSERGTAKSTVLVNVKG